MNMLLFKKIMKRNKLALISILFVLGVVLLVAIVDIPFFMDKISRGSSSLREKYHKYRQSSDSTKRPYIKDGLFLTN